MSKFLDLHILQTVPASCINRDDSNAPKTVIYGGSLRSRVSSQAWKYAMRKNFQLDSDKWVQSKRTKDMHKFLADAIQKQDNSLDRDQAVQMAVDVLAAGKIKVDFDKKTKTYTGTSTQLALSQGQIDNIAKFALTHTKDDLKKADVQKALNDVFVHYNSLDLALFGRMVASDTSLTVYAACQVAHAFSVNASDPQFDFFAAVDDNPDHAGADMLSSVGFNSGTLYRYSNLNLDLLKSNLADQDKFEEAIKLYMREFALSMPTGKENSYANKTLPYYILAIVRDDTPVNLASAFETPVASHTGYEQKAVDKLEASYDNSLKFVDQPAYLACVSNANSKFAQADNLNNLINNVINNL